MKKFRLRCFFFYYYFLLCVLILLRLATTAARIRFYTKDHTNIHPSLKNSVGPLILVHFKVVAPPLEIKLICL